MYIFNNDFNSRPFALERARLRTARVVGTLLCFGVCCRLGFFYKKLIDTNRGPFYVAPTLVAVLRARSPSLATAVGM